MDGLSNFWSSEQNAGRHENIRSPIKPISASGMRFVFRPRENSFDYFSGYAMLQHRLRSRNFRCRNCATVRTGNEFPAEEDASRGLETSCTVIGKVSGDG